MIGNGTGGFRFVDETRDNVLHRNNIFGNGSGDLNCGVRNESGFVVDATRNYWGAPTGPGPDPADEAHGACEAAGSQTNTTPFATEPFVPEP